MSHTAAGHALVWAAGRGRMQPLRGALRDVRAARLEARVGDLDRTLVVVESQELLRGQKRGIAVALRKAKIALRTLARRVHAGKLDRATLEARLKKTLGHEHLADFVVTTIGGTPTQPTLPWAVDAARRRELERTRLGRRVLCTTRRLWRTERIVAANRGQWKVDELFRRAKRGGVVPWGPSYQWADASLQLHTFATVLGLTLVALAHLALDSRQSVPEFMRDLGEIQATLVRTDTGRTGRRPTVMLAPDLSVMQRNAVAVFELARWMLTLSSTMPPIADPQRENAPVIAPKVRKSG